MKPRPRPRVAAATWLSALGLAWAAAGCVACSSKLAPLAVFPARTAWVVSGDDLLQPPLALDSTRLYAAGRAGTLRALDRLSGNVLWSLADRPGVVSAGDGRLLLRQEDGTLLSLEPSTGRTLWEARTGVSGALPAALGADRIVVAGAGLAYLEASSGRLLWSRPAEPVISAPPVHAPPWLLLGGADGRLYGVDAESGAPRWAYATGAPLVAPPLVDDQNRVLLGTSARQVVALRADQRGKRRWRWEIGGDVQAAPSLFGDMLLVAAFDAVLYAIDRGNGHLAWRAPLPSRPASGPLLFGAAVLVACHEKEIVGFDARTGKKLGALTTPAALQGAPLLAGDWLYAALRDRSVLALRLATEPPGTAPEPDAASPRPPRRRGTRPADAETPPASPSPTPGETLTSLGRPIN